MGELRTARAQRKIGEPTRAQRVAKAAIIAATATGRELDTQTMKNLTRVLAGLGIEAGAYTHLRPSVLVDDVVEAVKDIKAAVIHLNRLTRTMKAYVQSLEERADQ